MNACQSEVLACYRAASAEGIIARGIDIAAASGYHQSDVCIAAQVLARRGLLVRAPQRRWRVP